MKRSLWMLRGALLACALAAVMAGCQKKAAQGTASGGGGKTPPLQVAIVSSSGVDDGSFTQDCYVGMQAFQKTHPDAVLRSIKEPDLGKLVDAAAQIAADYDVLVLPGFQFAAIGTAAVNNPQTKFILVDAYPVDKDGKEVELPNVYGMMFKEQESGFFAGVASALETKTGKVAIVNGIAFPSNVNYQYGFMAGVNYANKHYGSQAKYVELPSYAGSDVNKNNVGGNYIGSFNDQSTGKVVGEALIGQGVDIIFVCAGGSGSGVFAAAKEKNSRVIGVDVDQYNDGANGSSNIVLTSALKVMNINVDRQLTAIAGGTFAGKNDLLDASTGSTGYVSAPGRQQLSADTLAKLEEVGRLLGNGTIVPPDNFSASTPEDFPGL